MTTVPTPRELLISTRVRRLEGGEPPHLDRDLKRVRRGYYRPAAMPLTPQDDYLLRIQAAVEARTEPMVICDESAAALWGAPLLKIDGALVHTNRAGKARRTAAGVLVHRRALAEEDVAEVAGLRVVCREWTAIHLAAKLPLPRVLLPLDHLVASLNPEPASDPSARGTVERLVAMIPKGMRGGDKARKHLLAADARSGSAGESLSRGQMHLLGVPLPDLQVAFPRGGDLGGSDIVDFDWPELGVFGEFDGRGKYFRSEINGGRSPEDVLWDEKQREDRVRHHRPRAAGWGWDVALRRDLLAAVLGEAGIRARG
ncbi:MAG: hypothetical protein ACXVDH_00435 [Nocardioides sp.]